MDIFGFFSNLLWPIKWVIEALLVGFHSGLTFLGLDPAAGFTWVLSIVGLVLVIRAALIPVFVRQIRSQRKMLEVAPQLKKIQDKYKGKKDQFSREAMSRETMQLYRDAGTSPFSSCIPLLIQMPVFFSLYAVLTEAREGKQGVGFLTKELSKQFGSASLFGGLVPLKDSIQSAIGEGHVLSIVVAVTMVVIMTASQFITQLQIMSKNQSPEMRESPMYRQQRTLLYILPLVFAFSGFAFPVGVMFYWLTSNIWTMVQQYLVIRNMPTPGSEAALAREARLARRAQRRMQNDANAIAASLEPGVELNGDAAAVQAKPRPTTQRQQPVGKNRAKKQQNPGGRK